MDPTTLLIIPFRDPNDAKSRLGSVLTDRQRADLAWYMFGHVLSVAGQVLDPKNILVVTRSARVRQHCKGSAEVFVEQEAGLNQALGAAIHAVRGEGERNIGIVHADLPALEPDDLRIVLDNDVSELGVAPDVHKQGTNAVSFHSASGFRPAFGDGSFRRHLAEAKRIGLETWPVVTPGLAQDVDWPEDLTPQVQDLTARRI